MSELIERTLTWKPRDGEPVSETIYFREMTAGDHVSATEGQRYRGRPRDGEIEIEVSLNLRAQHKRLQLTLVDAAGKQVFPKLDDLHKQNGRKVKALLRIAAEVFKEDDETEGDAAGNE